MDKPRDGESQRANVRAKWSDASKLRSEFASELNIVQAGHEYVLTFGEVRLPIVVGDPPANLEAEIRPLARIVVPQRALEPMIKALKSVLDTSSSKKERG